jgi:hypothetical protein
MNKLFLVLIVFSLIAAGCSKDDGVSTTPKYQGQSNLYLIYEEYLYGFIDNSGKTIIYPQFESAADFQFDLALVELPSGKKAFINKQGIIVIPGIYDWASSFTEDGLASVRKDNLYGYIDKSGKEAILPQFNNCFDFSEGLAAVLKDGKWGFIDNKGVLKITNIYSIAGSFSENLASVKETSGGKFGYIDKTGKKVIDFKYDVADEFINGLARIKKDGFFGLIDKNDTMVIKNIYKNVGQLYEDLIYFQSSDNNKFGFLDKSGKIIIEATYDAASDFSEGLAAIRVGNSYGYIDKTNKKVIEPKFAWAGDFIGSLAQVTFSDGYNGYIDKTGKTIWKSTSMVLY